MGLKRFLRNAWLPLIFGVGFFVAGVVTLGDYGISWDETIHFRRGAAYVYYFLTGRTNYDGLPVVNFQGTSGDPSKLPLPRRSFYQHEVQDGEYMLENDSGHPPLSDELAALSNYILFQKLGWVGDIQSYHWFNLAAAAVLVLVVVAFGGEAYGGFVGVVAGIVVATYPVFFAESHFNIKDPAETAFFAATLWTFWKAVKGKSWKWMLGSAVCFGLALGTKFNILFLPLILVPWLVLRYWREVSVGGFWSKWPKGFVISCLISPLLIGAIFFGSWPYLWQNPIGNTQKVFQYYREIGTGFRYQPDGFFVLGWNIFPIAWIIFTTPPLVLGLLMIGLGVVWKRRREKGKVAWLWLAWLLVPILRVSWPNTSIYGGIRQIMEFLPAMGLISGLGAEWLVKLGRRYSGEGKIKLAVLAVVLISGALISVKWHPNENVYFNFLIGGLSGAAQREFPSWGNSFGNAYYQAAKWLNENAEEGAKVALLQGTLGNLPVEWVRSDLNFDNHNWSGIDRGGEYLVELTFNDSGKSYYYAWEYVEKFLVPVYEVKVDGVAIAKVWKNDLEHTKPEWRLWEKEYVGEKKISVSGGNLTMDLGEVVNLSRVKLNLEKDEICVPIGNSFVETSDDGKVWVREEDWLPFQQVGRKENVTDGNVEFFWAGREARWVRFVFDSERSCGLRLNSLQVRVF